MEGEQLDLKLEEKPIIPYSDLAPKKNESLEEYATRRFKLFRDERDGLVIFAEPTADELEAERINKITDSFFGDKN